MFNAIPVHVISFLFFLLGVHLNHCKLVKAPAEDLDSMYPEFNHLPKFKLKNSADVLTPGRKGERKGSLHNAEIVTPPSLKKTKKAKETLSKVASHPHVGHLDTNFLLGAQNAARKDTSVVRANIVKPATGFAKPGSPGASPRMGDTKGLKVSVKGDVKGRKPETEAERAERINKQFEKMLQFTAMLGHVDSFLYDRTKSVVKTLHRMMGDSRELLDPEFNTNELRRRRHSSDPYRGEPNEYRIPSGYSRLVPVGLNEHSNVKEPRNLEKMHQRRHSAAETQNEASR